MKTAWLNFRDEDDADEVKEGYSDGDYEVLGQAVKCTGPTFSEGRNGGVWTVRLAELPLDATEEDIVEEIPSDLEPHHVEMGKPTYTESPHAASEKVKKILLAIGPLDSWEGGTGGVGKRFKATARFQHEEDARRAVASLDNTLLPFSMSAKLTAQLVHTARLKVYDRIYEAARLEIEAERKAWKSKHVVFVVYPEVRSNRVLRLEGENSKSVADASRKLEDMLSGEIALRDRKPIWTASFGVGGGIQEKVKRLEAHFGVMIVRNKRRSRLHLYGAPGKRHAVIKILGELVTEEDSA
ncbi:hypothetical protein IMZ48_26490, partial [Candidatus Bathyarchaeota archaeon]|nr:hypothetical protein [Candidatus Bathyarchaeota archaeon]